MNWYEWFFWIVWAIGILMILTYAFVLPFGAPYLPTKRRERQQALNLLNLKPGQTVVDLGSGDGSFLISAAENGLCAIGYEINPFLWLISRLRTLRYGSQVRVKLRSFWRADLNHADGVFVFLIERKMAQLDKLLNQQSTLRLRSGQEKPLPVVSHAFKIPGQKIIKQSGPLFLYIYK